MRYILPVLQQALRELKGGSDFVKKKLVLIVVVLIAASLILAVKFGDGEKTMEEAINMPGSNRVSIIHDEKNDKGSIVFCYTSDGKGLYTAVVTKGISGYKTVYSGVQGDIKLTAERFGLSYCYFPAIEKTALPIYYGVIGNPDISEVKIIEKKRNVTSPAKIMDANGTRLWLVYMSEFEGSDFDIVGLSADGKEIVRIDGNISPYYAEQKPFKGYE